MSSRGAKLLALALKNNVSTPANINNLEPFVTYNFEVTNNRNPKVDDQPCDLIHDRQATTQDVQSPLPSTDQIVSNLLDNINDTPDVSNEFQGGLMQYYENNIDIMLLPDLEKASSTVQNDIPEILIDQTGLSANDIHLSQLETEKNVHDMGKVKVCDQDLMSLPDIDASHYSNRDVIESENNLYSNQNKSDCNTFDITEQDYVAVSDVDDNISNNSALSNEPGNSQKDQEVQYADKSDLDNFDITDPDYIPASDADDINSNNSALSNESGSPQKDQAVQDVEDDDNENIPLKRRKKVADRSCWDKYVNQKKRMNGNEYIGYTRKDGVVTHNIKRNQRQLGPKCTSTFCKKVSNRHCHLFTDEIRQTIFRKFWDLDWEQKRLFIAHMVNYSEKQRSYILTPSRRTGSFQYYLKLDTGKFQVCKKTFLGTLGMNEKMVVNWVHEGKKFGLIESKEKRNLQTTEKRRTSKLFTDTQERRDHLRRFFKQIPKMESHYCRQNTHKLYLEEDFKSQTEVYELYKKKCLADSVTPLSNFTFSRIMEDMNIGLFKPRKDQCDFCFAYKIKQKDENDYKEHIRAKETARNEKGIDKKRAEEDLIYAYTMDVQAVKLCPKVEVSTAYYKTKLQIHNFTIYNLKTHHSKNFLWNESEAELCSSVFATCIVKHLESTLNVEVKPIVLWSDSCGYQNKNVILSNALSLLASKYHVTIEQKYLEKGHTQMECDSTHSLIERRLKGRDIFLPTDYINIIKDARKKPFPLDVEYLSHSYFFNYDDPNCKRYNSIRPGNKKTDFKVNNLRCLQYKPSGEIFYKCKFTDPYVLLPQRQKIVDINYVPKPLYQERLKIKKVKWTHLQEFKSVLPEDVHFFYDSLAYYSEKENTTDGEKTKIVKNQDVTESDSDTPEGDRNFNKRSTKNCENTITSAAIKEAKKIKQKSSQKSIIKGSQRLNNKKKPEKCRKSKNK